MQRSLRRSSSRRCGATLKVEVQERTPAAVSPTRGDFGQVRSPARKERPTELLTFTSDYDSKRPMAMPARRGWEYGRVDEGAEQRC